MNNKTKFYFSEVATLHSYREAEALKANTLSAAKREASRKRSFFGTFLYIGNSINEQGFIVEPLSVKTREGWRDITE